MENPWLRLPESPPFVLPADAPYVDAFNHGLDEDHHLDLTVLPQPFLGPRDAEVVVLGRNPGARGWSTGSYADALRDDLLSPAGSLLPPLRAEFAANDGRWWSRCFGAVAVTLGEPVHRLADRILSVEFHGYHSVKWRNMPVTLPSQRHSFDLVAEAIDRGASVVALRGLRDWSIAVPGLLDADPIVLKNPRTATISPRNCGEAGFGRVVEALTHRLDPLDISVETSALLRNYPDADPELVTTAIAAEVNRGLTPRAARLEVERIGRVPVAPIID